MNNDLRQICCNLALTPLHSFILISPSHLPRPTCRSSFLFCDTTSILSFVFSWHFKVGFLLCIDRHIAVVFICCHSQPTYTDGVGSCIAPESIFAGLSFCLILVHTLLLCTLAESASTLTGPPIRRIAAVSTILYIHSHLTFHFSSP